MCCSDMFRHFSRQMQQGHILRKVFSQVQIGSNLVKEQGLEGVLCEIWDLAKIDCMTRKYKLNSAVIHELHIGCDVGFTLSVVRDS